MAMQKLYDLNESDFAAEFGEATGDENLTSGLSVATQSISGLGVEEVEHDDAADQETIDNLLSMFKDNEEFLAKDFQAQEDQRDAYREAEEKRIAEIEAKYNQERYEKEQALKAERLAKEREEEERLQREEEERRANSFMGKISGFAKGFGKKKKVEEIVSETVEEVAEPITEEVPDISEFEEEYVAPITDTPDDDFESYMDTEVANTEETPESPVVEVSKDLKEKKKISLFGKKTSEPKEVKETKDKTVKAKPVKESKVKSTPVKTPKTSNGEPDWKWIAQHDELTGLLNIRAYDEKLKSTSDRSAIIFFDINNLKYVNDTLGHDSGDTLIKTVAGEIKKQYGENNVYRIGGDEFVAIIDNPGRNATDTFTEKNGKIHNALNTLVKEEGGKIPYSVAIGFAVGDGKHVIEDIVKAADMSMYRNKKAYKDSHPQYSRGNTNTSSSVEVEEEVQDHDELLTKEQKDLKDKIARKHQVVNNMSTQQLIRTIQQRASEIKAIFISSSNFDYLFIIRDVNEFINIALEQSAIIDYSYLYVVYEGGPCYYGADEYYAEVTHIFEDITEGLMRGKFMSEKDIKSIKGINIFREVYV